VRAPTWVYDARAVSRPVLYTEPTAAQIPHNFPFRASARSPGRLLEGGVVCQELQRDVERTMWSISGSSSGTNMASSASS
jgi:hypothetical protein